MLPVSILLSIQNKIQNIKNASHMVHYSEHYFESVMLSKINRRTACKQRLDNFPKVVNALKSIC